MVPCRAGGSAMGTRLVHRTCSLCEAHCGVSVEVDAAERVLAVRGDPDDPMSRGYLCPKAHGLLALQEDPDRLRRPLRREGDAWREIGWDAAFELLAERLGAIRAAHGPEAIGAYVGNPNA